jgi:hypothetical protein
MADTDLREINMLKYSDGWTWQCVFEDGIRVEGKRRYVSSTDAAIDGAQFASLVAAGLQAGSQPLQSQTVPVLAKVA